MEIKSVLGKSPFGTLNLVLYSEVISIVSLIRSVPYSECPLPEVPLYMRMKLCMVSRTWVENETHGNLAHETKPMALLFMALC